MYAAVHLVRDRISKAKVGRKMITTSNFAKNAKHPDAVAISQGVPRFYRESGTCPLLRPAGF